MLLVSRQKIRYLAPMRWPWKRRTTKVARPERRLVSLSAAMRAAGSEGNWASVRILNASISGLHLRAERPPAVGQRIEVKYRSLSIRGQILRVDGHRFAIEADRPIDLEQLLTKSDLATKSAMTANPGTGESPLHWSNRD